MNYNDNTLLSVLIITLNEAKQMKPLLADLQFADEVVIVDSYSTDETEEVVYHCIIVGSSYGLYLILRLLLLFFQRW